MTDTNTLVIAVELATAAGRYIPRCNICLWSGKAEKSLGDARIKQRDHLSEKHSG